MNDKQKIVMKNLFNRLELIEIKLMDEKTVIFDFKEEVRLFIDSGSSGIDFSMTAMSDKAVKVIESLETE